MRSWRSEYVYIKCIENQPHQNLSFFFFVGHLTHYRFWEVEAAIQKRRKYDAELQQVHNMPLIPLVMDAFGALHRDTIDVVRHMKARITGDEPSVITSRLFQQLSVLIHSAAGRMIYSRVDFESRCFTDADERDG